MSNVNLNFTAQYSAQQTTASGILAGVQITIPETLSCIMSNGTAADKINLIGFSTYTFVGTTPQTCNLQALTDVNGVATVFLRSRFAIFKLYGTTTDGVSLVLGAAVTSPWTGILSATGTMTMQAPSTNNPNGAFFIFGAPNTTGFVVGNTNKNLLMTPTANCTLDLLVYGSDT